MNTITTKFSVGDVVYLATTHTTKKRHDCPDCGGSRKWKAESPVGQEYEIPCPRCNSSHISDRNLSLDYTAHEPSTARLTIGSIRLDTNDKNGGVSYMCSETGVGSGTVYKEKDFYTTEEQALEHAKFLANDRNENTAWIVEMYNKTLSLSDYQFSDAKTQAAKNKDNKLNNKVRDLLNDVYEAQTLEEMRIKVDEFSWT